MAGLQRKDRQRGWAGLLSLLLALVIVGFVMRTLLKHMAGDAAPAPGSPRAASVEGLPGGVAAPPLERARAVEGQLQREADEARRRIDAADQGGARQ